MRNNERNSTLLPTAMTKAIMNATIGSLGTVIDNIQAGSSAGNPSLASIGSAESQRLEWVFKKSSTYTLYADSLASNNVITLKGEWYEE